MSKVLIILIILASFGCRPQLSKTDSSGKDASDGKTSLTIQTENPGIFAVYRENGKDPILTQVAKANERPYIHPIVAPDGKGILTEYRPKHHLHQTGLYWGLKKVNGRDYFMKWQGDYWQQVSAKVVERNGQQVKWQTQYNLLDSLGNTTLTETQNWTMQERNGKYLLDLEWKGEAKTNVKLAKFYVGGLFLRMPWDKETAGEVVNAVGQRNRDAEAQRAPWIDVGMEIDGRQDWAHFAILDHPNNKAFPISWRVDNELGVGPSRQIMGDWEIPKGETEVVRYRLVVYTGVLNQTEMTRNWKEFVCEF